MIEFQSVYKHFHVKGQRIEAVQPCSLKIPRGEIYGLIGHSGAGKSTLLRLINRLEEPSGGRILVEGQDITALDAEGLRRYRRQVGMIFQHFNLLSAKTVAENVALPLKLSGDYSKVQIQDKVTRLLQRVGLEDQASKYPAQLSGGQKQRVGIARALSTDPKILLCDEATSALDPQTTAQVLQLLAEINRELQLTLVLITHEMDVIRRVCHQVAVLDQGAVVEQGRVADVFLHPQHPTTQRFVREVEQQDSLPGEAYSKIAGQLLRLTFRGEDTFQPLLSRVARETGVDFTLLNGRVDRIGDEPYGQLTLALQGERAAEAQQRFIEAGIHLEVLDR